MGALPLPVLKLWRLSLAFAAWKWLFLPLLVATLQFFVHPGLRDFWGHQEAESCSMASSRVCPRATQRNHEEGPCSGLRVLRNLSLLLTAFCLPARKVNLPRSPGGGKAQ